MSPKPPIRIVPSPGSAAAPKSVRVLIADDDRDSANMLAVVLRDEGHDAVVVAQGGDEALEMSRLFRPDVVIADLNRPGVSGYAIARELKERHGTLSPLLIAISGTRTNTSDRFLGRTVGFDHYLAKPCDLTQVLGLIRDSQDASSGKFTREA